MESNDTALGWERAAREIDDCEHLFARSIREVEELTLEVILEEAKPQAPILTVRDGSLAGGIVVGGRPIETDLSCRAFRVLFRHDHMVAYMVSNESFSIYPAAPEEFTGRLFRVFSKSHLLDFTKRTTCGSDEYPGMLRHYQLACLNHVIDVICTAPPEITWRRGDHGIRGEAARPN